MISEYDKTHENILKSAKKEFSEHGFTGASLRQIAAGAGLTTGALYRHFKDKDDLFAALVSPVCKAFLEQYDLVGDGYLEQLDQSGVEAMWESSSDSIRGMIEYTYQYFDIFRILIMASEQTPFEDFTNQLVEKNVDLTQRYLEAAQKKGYRVNMVTRDDLHILINAQMSCVFEMLIHNVPHDKAVEQAGRISKFFTGGWQKLITE